MGSRDRTDCKFGAKWGDPTSNKQLKNRYKAEEMDVLFGKVPACKHEDLRLDPQKLCKMPGKAAHVCNLRECGGAHQQRELVDPCFSLAPQSGFHMHACTHPT